jgi:hypothetical protein
MMQQGVRFYQCNMQREPKGKFQVILTFPLLDAAGEANHTAA